jgi:hypothetical protein
MAAFCVASTILAPRTSDRPKRFRVIARLALDAPVLVARAKAPPNLRAA